MSFCSVERHGHIVKCTLSFPSWSNHSCACALIELVYWATFRCFSSNIVLLLDLVYLDFEKALSHWCIFHRSKAEQVVVTWDKQFHSSDMTRKVPLLYLANDILQNSKRNGNEFVNEFWKVLPSALKDITENGDDRGKNVVSRLVRLFSLFCCFYIIDIPPLFKPQTSLISDSKLTTWEKCQQTHAVAMTPT